MRLRQIALVGQDLAAARADIVAVLRLGDDYADPDVDVFGLHNAVWPVGHTFLEVVSPKQEGTTAGRLLKRRGGDGGYMVILQIDHDMAAARRRMADLGVRIVHQIDRDGGKVSYSHLHPTDVGGAILSLDVMVPKERWEWGGPRWRENVKTDMSLAIVGAELQADDPDAMSARWSQVLDRPRRETAEGFRIGLEEGGEIRFAAVRDGRGEGLGAFDVSVRNAATVRAAAKTRGALDAKGGVVLCGTRVNLVEARESGPTTAVA
ncbi:VOC family protein [Phenylobacterium sp.]|uniref:VOC family protein n=1 Tax=Phenylobacterium sp. TaxID=1871053 RepID=UPI0027371A29|nr:VOC family protein [Phenylobacterium sp.]MDP3852215.1 VOC family protein [Phenylobacterium sp.]